MFEDEPRLAGRDAARAGVEADSDPLVGEVRARGDGVERLAGQLGRGGAAGGVGEFERADEKRAVVHLAPRLPLHGRGTDGVPLRQAGEIGVGDGDELRRVVFGEEGLADVVNDVVLLPRDELRLRGHEAPPAGERLIHRVGVGAVGEFTLGETQGVGDGAGEIQIAVTGVTDDLVNFFPARDRGFVPAANELSVVDRLLIVGQSGFGQEQCPRRQAHVLRGEGRHQPGATESEQKPKHSAAGGGHGNRRRKNGRGASVDLGQFLNSHERFASGVGGIGRGDGATWCSRANKRPPSFAASWSKKRRDARNHCRRSGRPARHRLGQARQHGRDPRQRKETFPLGRRGQTGKQITDQGGSF